MPSLKTTPRFWWAKSPPARITPHRSGDIACGDALECLAAIRDQTADVVFLDPPFNLGKAYGDRGARADRMCEDEYHSFMSAVLVQSVRILRDGGALYLYHIPKWALRFSSILSESLSFRHWIAISMKNGFARGKNLYPAHYALLYYTKGAPGSFHRPKVKALVCPHCDEYIRDYGGYRKHIENGINLSDIWDDISPVRHRKYKLRKANELPLAIPRRVMEISGRRGGLLVDPFAGTGSSVVAARMKNMKFVAIDRQPDNCALIAERLTNISG